MNRILTTTKGNQLLLHEGYQYRFVSKTKRDARNIYRCIKKGCKSRLHTDNEDKVICIRNQHNHSENYSAAEVRLHRWSLKQAAMNGEISRENILKSRKMLSNVTAVPSYEADRRFLSRKMLAKSLNNHSKITKSGNATTVTVLLKESSLNLNDVLLSGQPSTSDMNGRDGKANENCKLKPRRLQEDVQGNQETSNRQVHQEEPYVDIESLSDAVQCSSGDIIVEPTTNRMSEARDDTMKDDVTTNMNGLNRLQVKKCEESSEDSSSASEEASSGVLYFDDIVEDVTQSSPSSSIASSAKETAQWLCSPSGVEGQNRRAEFIRHLLLYEFNRGSKATEAARNIRAVYGEKFLAESTARKWFARFREGNFDLNDAPRSNWLSAAEKVKRSAMICNDSQSSSTKCAERLHSGSQQTVVSHAVPVVKEELIDIESISDVSPPHSISDVDIKME
uniref:Mos1 transposase HTH domain-containing protein n=1 Tax=Parascaris univalens TaxID=6257 RepID=A0A915B354_PARUN